MISWSEYEMTPEEKKKLIDFRRIEELHWMTRGKKRALRSRAEEYVERGLHPGEALERAEGDFGVPLWGGRIA